MTHTLGPWYANTKGNQGIVYTEKDGNNIAVSYDVKNACLIAAAPELLESLQDCCSELNQLAFLHGDKLAKITLNKARAAIQKAMEG